MVKKQRRSKIKVKIMSRWFFFLCCLFLIQKKIDAMDISEIIPDNTNPISVVQRPPRLNAGEGGGVAPLPIPVNSSGGLLGFVPGGLADFAPVAMTMYCFKENPQVTMIALTTLLLALLLHRDIIKKKYSEFKSKVLNNLHDIQQKGYYFWLHLHL